jgi:uncharacterized protein (DUF885 family)
LICTNTYPTLSDLLVPMAAINLTSLAERHLRRAKEAFSLKDFHSSALGLGSMGLDPLRQALARL